MLPGAQVLGSCAVYPCVAAAFSIVVHRRAAQVPDPTRPVEKTAAADVCGSRFVCGHWYTVLCVDIV